jgi:AcrR family transcriptional regulator
MSEASGKKMNRSQRELNLEATRAAVVAAAGRLFLERGYARSTMVDIAREAGVSVQTLYNAVGNKAELLSRVFQARVSGPHAPRPVPEVLAERTQEIRNADGVVRLLSSWFTEVHPRMAPLWRVVEEAGATDPDVARLARERALGRLAGYRRAAQALGDRGGIPAALEADDVAALIWAIGHPRVHHTLVDQLGWTPDRYEAWITRVLGVLVDSARREVRDEAKSATPR